MLTPTPGFVVNEAFAKAYLSDVDPLRASLSVWMQEQNPYLPVIGVVGNVSEGSVRERPQPTVFYSHRQMSEIGMTLFVRAHYPACDRLLRRRARFTRSIRTLRSPTSGRSTRRSPTVWRASVSARWSPVDLP